MDALREFQFLSQCKSLGFYNCGELTTVFLYQKAEKTSYHYFTICVLEERVRPEAVTEYITPALIALSGNVSMGIKRRVCPLDEIAQIVAVLSQAEGESVIDIGDGALATGKLEAVPKRFIPQNSTKEIALNRILKNNFRNGSYVLEFFDVEKKSLQILDKKAQEKAAAELYSYIPVDLFTISDRIGNFVFQFPSINAKISYRQEDGERLVYQVDMDDRLTGEGPYQLSSELYHDDTITGFGSFVCTVPHSSIEIFAGDVTKMCRTTLIDEKRQIVLARQDTTFMQRVFIRMHIDTNDTQRLIWNENRTEVTAIDIVSGENIRVGEPEQKRENNIKNRQYARRMEELVAHQEFRCYGTAGAERAQALEDIRALMNRGDGGTVYLWDPYLTVQDLLETWYYTTSWGIKLHAVTSKEASGGLPVPEWIEAQRKIMSERSNHYGIFAELRCQWGRHGYGFHDRFLMVLHEDKKPQVWSLGTSVNSLGKSHHIIQSVSHPQPIVDAFEELWDKLSVEECLVWKYGE